MKGKITDAGSGGAEDGFCADQLVDLPPHLPLELEHLGHALLDVLGPGDTLCQAGSPTRKKRRKGLNQNRSKQNKTYHCQNY